MSGPTWLPPKQPEPARASQGRAHPRGAPGPPPAHGAGKTAPVPLRRPRAGRLLQVPLSLPLPLLPQSWAGTSVPCPLRSRASLLSLGPQVWVDVGWGEAERRRVALKGGLHKYYPYLFPHLHLHSLFPHPSTPGPPQGQFLPHPI